MATDYAGMTQLNAVPQALRGVRGRIIYLARERSSQRLVALQLHAGSAPGQMWLEVLRRLDASVPNLEERCGFCQRVVAAGSKYCSKCGADLTVLPSGSSDEVLEAVKQATGGRYEFLGRMEYGDRRGVVFIMKDRSSGRLAALRLHKRHEDHLGKRIYDLEQTAVMGRMAQEVGAEPASAQADDRLLQAIQATVGSEYEVLGELGRVEEAPRVETRRATIRVDQPPPQPELPPAPPPPAPNNRFWLWLGGGLLAALILLALFWPRSRRPQQAVLDPPPPVVSDSATIEIGGALPVGAQIRIDGVRVRRGAHRVPAGVHLVEASAPGFVAVAESLEVSPNVVATWGPRLRSGGRPTPRPAPPRRSTPPPPAPVPTPVVTERRPDPPPEASCSSLFNASQDWSQVFRRCQEQAALNVVVAQQILGLLYEKGLGTPANYAAAAEWYQRSAGAGNPKAQFYYGRLLWDGAQGFERNRNAAVGWFSKAAAQGEPEAMVGLGRALMRGEGTRRNQAEAVQWFQQAAAKNVADGLYELSFAYRDGAGVTKSDSLALALMERASALGHPLASRELPKLRERYTKSRGGPAGG